MKGNKEKSELDISSIVGRKVGKVALRKYIAVLESRGLALEDAAADELERNYMRLWFALNQGHGNKRGRG